MRRLLLQAVGVAGLVAVGIAEEWEARHRHPARSYPPYGQYPRSI